jgi:hypothetical protein
MPAKKHKTSAVDLHPEAARNFQPTISAAVSTAASSGARTRGASSTRKAGTNGYVCALERTQTGKYNMRVRAIFAEHGRRAATRAAKTSEGSWTLPVYYLASSFPAVMKKLEESLQFLQKNEERLRFWGVERTDDPNVAGELLKEIGLRLDRRRDFPRKVVELGVPRERPLSAAMLAPVRRVLAESLAQERPAGRSALASD